MSDKNDTALANPEDVTSVYFDEYHDGASGVELVDEGRPTIFKLDHNKGHYYAIDDEDEHHQELFVVIINCRIYYRKFKNNQVVCESDNGKFGYDTELSVERSCDPPVKGDNGKPTGEGCPYSYLIKGYPGQGQCSLGMSIQGLAVLDDQAMTMTINMAGSSARSFSTYLKKLKRRKISMRGILTRMSSRHIKTAENEWYAGEFKTVDGELEDSLAQQVQTIVADLKAQALGSQEPAQLEAGEKQEV